MERVGERPDTPAGAIALDLDLRGEVCPYTFLKARLALETVTLGARLRVIVDNPTSARDVPRSLSGAGHQVLNVEETAAGVWAIVVEKRGP